MECWTSACDNADSYLPLPTTSAADVAATLTVFDQDGQPLTVMDPPVSVATVGTFTYAGGLEFTTEAPLEMPTTGTESAAATMIASQTAATPTVTQTKVSQTIPLSTSAASSLSLDLGTTAMPTFSSPTSLPTASTSATSTATSTVTSLNPTETSQGSSSSSAPHNDQASKGLTTGAAIGIAAGGLALLALLVTLLAKCRRRLRRSSRDSWTAPIDPEDMWAPTNAPGRSFVVRNTSRKPVPSFDSSSILFPSAAYKNGDSFVTAPSALGNLYVANGGVWSPASASVSLGQQGYQSTPPLPSQPFAPPPPRTEKYADSGHWRTHSHNSYYSYFGQHQAGPTKTHEVPPFAWEQGTLELRPSSSSTVHSYASLGPRPRPVQSRARLVASPDDAVDGRDEYGVALPPLAHLSPDMETIGSPPDVPSSLRPGQLLRTSPPAQPFSDRSLDARSPRQEHKSFFSDASTQSRSSSVSHRPDLHGPYPPRTVAPLNIRKRSSESSRSRSSSLAEILAGPPSRPSRALRPPSEPTNTPRQLDWPAQEITVRPPQQQEDEEGVDSRRWTEQPSVIAYLASSPRGPASSGLARAPHRSPSMVGSSTGHLIWPPVLRTPSDAARDDRTSSSAREDLASKTGTPYSTPERLDKAKRHVGLASPTLHRRPIAGPSLPSPSSLTHTQRESFDGVQEAFGIIDRVRERQRRGNEHLRKDSEAGSGSEGTASSMSLTSSMRRTQAWLAANHYEHF